MFHYSFSLHKVLTQLLNVLKTSTIKQTKNKKILRNVCANRGVSKMNPTKFSREKWYLNSTSTDDDRADDKNLPKVLQRT